MKLYVFEHKFQCFDTKYRLLCNIIRKYLKGIQDFHIWSDDAPAVKNCIGGFENFYIFSSMLSENWIMSCRQQMLCHIY